MNLLSNRLRWRNYTVSEEPDSLILKMFSEMFQAMPIDFQRFPEIVQRLFGDVQRFPRDCSEVVRDCSEMLQRSSRDAQRFSECFQICSQVVSEIRKTCSHCFKDF